MKALLSLTIGLLFSLSVLAADNFKLKVEGMTCGGCEKTVESAVMSVPGVKTVKANHKTGAVVVTTDDKVKVSEASVVEAINKTEDFKVKK